MRRSLATKLVLAISLLGVVLPVMTALYLAHRQSIADGSQQASQMADEVLRRADDAGRQAYAAYVALVEAPQSTDPCSDARMELMRELALSSRYLQLVGWADGDRLYCSSLGHHQPPIELGPVDYVSALDTRIRKAATLGAGPGPQLLFMEKGGAAAAMLPEVLVDVFVNESDTALGIYGRNSRQHLAGRGAFKLDWIDRLGDATDRIFFDGQHLVALSRSSQFDFVAYAAIPEARLTQRLEALIWVLLPITLLAGVALSLGLYFLARQRASLPVELRAALKRREFVLHYQPIIELTTRRVVGFEALMRWPQRDGTFVRPDLFIPAAEDCGLIPQFTRYALQQLQTDLPLLRTSHPGCYVSVNLGAADLQSDQIVGQLAGLTGQTGLGPDSLIVEATEHSFLDPQMGSKVVSRIRSLGIRVAIDDFGTGYSGLSHLANLKADYLKIDKVFIDTVGTDSATGQVALHIIRIAESLQLQLIGEGVETELQAAFLREHGVRFAQGWLFHKAMPLDDALTLR